MVVNGKFFLVIVFLVAHLIAFPPRDKEIFKQNCLRLLKSSQYSFLTEYFSKYYPNFSQSSDFAFIEKVILQIPFLEQKLKIVNIYLENSQKIDNEVYSLGGQLYLLQEEPQKALGFFKKYKGKFNAFYIGLAQQKMGNFVDAENSFLKIIKTSRNSILNQQIYVLLAEIYLKWDEKEKALQQIKKIKNQDLRDFFHEKVKA